MAKVIKRLKCVATAAFVAKIEYFPTIKSVSLSQTAAIMGRYKKAR